MSIESKIRSSINDCREKLRVIEAAVSEEIKRPLFQRRRDLLIFLYKEKEVYTFALRQLENLLGGGR